MTHEEAVKNVPKKMRERFMKDLEMSPMESHFGMNHKWLLIFLIADILGTVFLGMVLS